MSSVVAFFIGLNSYAYFAGALTRMLKDQHGTKKGFLISNLIIIGALVLVALLAHQLGTL